MEVDTGAAASLAHESVLASLLLSVELQKPILSSGLRTYTGEQIPVKGTISVDIEYGQQRHRNLLSSLMGRDWLKVVKLDRKK